MNVLTTKQKKYLRALAHDLKPIVYIGQQGLSEAVLNDTNRALDDHELIKVRVRVGDRKARDEIIEELCSKSAAALIQRVGNVALLYRPNLKKKLEKQLRLPSK